MDKCWLLVNPQFLPLSELRFLFSTYVDLLSTLIWVSLWIYFCNSLYLSVDKKDQIEIEVEIIDELEVTESEFKRDLESVILSDTQRPKDSETS